jgi:hypothetical protein
MKLQKTELPLLLIYVNGLNNGLRVINNTVLRSGAGKQFGGDDRVMKEC